MAIENIWQVNTLERELADGYVKKVIYRVKGMDDGVEKTRATGEVNLEKPKTLIPYGDLTEEVVLGWVKDKLGSEQVTGIEKAIEEQIVLINTPKTATGTPW